MKEIHGVEIKYKVLEYFKALSVPLGHGGIKDNPYIKEKASLIAAIPDNKGINALFLLHENIRVKILYISLQKTTLEYLENNKFISLDKYGESLKIKML